MSPVYNPALYRAAKAAMDAAAEKGEGDSATLTTTLPGWGPKPITFNLTQLKYYIRLHSPTTGVCFDVVNI